MFIGLTGSQGELRTCSTQVKRGVICPTSDDGIARSIAGSAGDLAIPIINAFPGCGVINRDEGDKRDREKRISHLNLRQVSVVAQRAMTDRQGRLDM